MAKIIINSNTAFSIYHFRFGLINKLIEDGHEIICISNEDEYCEKIENLGCKHIKISLDNKGTNPINDMSTMFRYRKLYKQIKPQLILNYTIKPAIYSSLAAHSLKIPFVNIITGLGSAFILDNLVTCIARILYRISQKHAKKVIFLNEQNASVFIKNRIIAPHQVDVLPGEGININYYKLAEFPSTTGGINILYIGRVIAHKGFYELIEAAKVIKKHFPQVNFKVLGPIVANNPSAIKRVEVEEWVKQDIINYLGTTNDVREAIFKSHCIILPSYSEGISRALLEAAAMGRPIITTNVPGCREVVDDEKTGYLCAPKNSADLIKAIMKFVKLNKNDMEKMGLLARDKIVKDFSEEYVIRKYLSLIDTFV